MDNNLSKKNKSLIIISGVTIDRTPVIKSLLSYYAKIDLIKIEYKYRKRLTFIFKSLFIILKNRCSHIFFIGIQTLPIIFITQLLLKKYFYWELESYNFSSNNSLVIKMLYFNRLIDWTKVYLILPDVMRINKDERKIIKKLIIPNVPLRGREFQQRSLKKNDKIRLIFYGNLDNNFVYVNEWITFAKTEPNVFLTLIGWNFDSNIVDLLPKNVEYKSMVFHKELLSILTNYHFSIVGYRPIDFNHKFCAPNKLYEAFSLSLPVLANIKNPTLSSIIKETDAGLLIDFDSNINKQFNFKKILLSYEMYSLNAFNAYKNKYYFENFAKIQLDPLLIK